MISTSVNKHESVTDSKMSAPAAAPAPAPPAPAAAPGAAPAPAAAPTPAPGPTPGTTPGSTPGTTPGPTPGTTPGPTPGTAPGPTPGTAPGPTPGTSAPEATPNATSAPPGSTATTNPGINWQFIGEREGVKTQMYVPKGQDNKVAGHSGATIATGLDLGEKTAEQFTNLGVSDDLVAKLKPYMGKKGQDASDYIDAHPLTLSKEEIGTLDGLYQKDSTARFTTNYNKAVGESGKPFTELPGSVQTVLMSVTHQYGNIQKKCPYFWQAATKQDWNGMVKELRNFGDDYGPRRNLEADLIQRELDKNSAAAETAPTEVAPAKTASE